MIHVLIAEDDFRIAQVEEQFLKKVPGVNLVGKALNAKETLKLLNEHDVNLLLLDIYMPDELGTELLPKIKSQFPALDIIMITAATEVDMLKTSIQYGVTNYLIKPVTMEKFIETIEQYKRKKQLLMSTHDIDQSVIDQYFGNGIKVENDDKYLPSGVDSITLQKVKDILDEEKYGISIEEMGSKMGASRTTARRYLEYLVSINVCIAEQEYGVVGRPERKYYLVK
jgi:two-component system, CitB family, response regulator CitT